MSANDVPLLIPSMTVKISEVGGDKIMTYYIKHDQSLFLESCLRKYYHSKAWKVAKGHAIQTGPHHLYITLQFLIVDRRNDLATLYIMVIYSTVKTLFANKEVSLLGKKRIRFF